MDVVGHAHATGLRECLKPSGYVYAIPQELTTSDHHVPYVEPYAESQLPVFRNFLVLLPKRLLNLHRTLHRVHHAWELSKYAVTCRVGYATTMPSDEPIHDLTIRRKALIVPASSALIRRE
jgi:hypothetical protein